MPLRLAAVLLLACAAMARAQDGGGMPDHGAMDHGTVDHGATAPAPAGADTEAARAYKQAMTKMHAAMDVPLSGDADRDFLTGMIAHHEGAIAMAEVELRFGRNDRARALAQAIVDAQRAEIAAMRQMLAEMR